jgi:hypothetical protein
MLVAPFLHLLLAPGAPPRHVTSLDEGILPLALDRKFGEVASLSPPQWAAVAAALGAALRVESGVNSSESFGAALHKLGLRPACAMKFYTEIVPSDMRRDPDAPGYVAPPVPAPGIDFRRCR